MALAFTLHAAESLPPELEGIGIDEKAGAPISLDLEFTGEAGERTPLKKFFDGKKPVILSLAYYSCPTLCGFIFNGVVTGLKNLAWSSGKEFEWVNVSIDPKETPELAAAKKQNYLAEYGRSGAEKGWHFLTGDEADIQKLASEVGFHYRYDAEEKQYAHAAGIFIVSPEGKLSRTLYGIDYPARDLRLALTEASQGKIGSVVDRLMLFCYRYDPKAKRYSLYAANLMRAGGVLTVLGLGFLIFRLKRKGGV